MFEDEPSEEQGEESKDPARRAEEESARLRMHAELAAVFEGPRKFDAEVKSVDGTLMRDLQRSIGKLEKSRESDSPLIPPDHASDAAAALMFSNAHDLSTNDYHVHHRPGETMIARWLTGDEVKAFYTRIQAHFDASFNAFRDDEKQSKQWKQDPATLAYLEALDAVQVKMPDRYLREIVNQHRVFLMTTQTADEMNIAYLADTVMGVPVLDLVAKQSAPPDEPKDQDLAWYFKLFSLRGIVENVERMCFFTYLQKTDDSFDF